MPEVRRSTDYPNILRVGGKSIYQYKTDYRGELREYLYGLNSRESPVRKGSHDFWITYPYPPLIGHSPNFSWEEMNVTPRPLRGIVEMAEVPVRQLPDDYRALLREEMHTLLQEVGHHWLVPGQLRFRSGNETIAAPEIHDLVRRINRGSFPDSPFLIGRTGNHWSVFTDAMSTPLDGQAYNRAGDRDTLVGWQAARRRHATISVSGEDGGAGSLEMLSAFNDAELFLMGVVPAAEVYKDLDPPGRLRYLAPRVTSPYDYQIGLFVKFDNGDYYTFGFYRSHDVLAASSSTGDHVELSLGAAYRPFTGPGVAMRIVRRGNHYYFQAKHDTPYEDLEHTSVHGIFDDFDTLPEPAKGASWQRFRTVAHWQRGGTPVAIGLIVRRWSGAFLAEGRFFNFELKTGAGSQGWNLNSTPREVRRPPDYATLPTEILYHHNQAGTTKRVSNNRLFITAPFSTLAASQKDGFKHYERFDIGSDGDRAPKLFIRPAAGDFAFGSSVRVARVIPTPWAGGDIQGRTMWGEARAVQANRMLVPDGWAAKRTAPANDRYRCAFIVVAEDADDVPDEVLRDLDVVRRYFGSAFYAATRKQRRILSTLG